MSLSVLQPAIVKAPTSYLAKSRQRATVEKAASSLDGWPAELGGISQSRALALGVDLPNAIDASVLP